MNLGLGEDIRLRDGNFSHHKSVHVVQSCSEVTGDGLGWSILNSCHHRETSSQSFLFLSAPPSTTTALWATLAQHNRKIFNGFRLFFFKSFSNLKSFKAGVSCCGISNLVVTSSGRQCW